MLDEDTFLNTSPASQTDTVQTSSTSEDVEFDSTLYKQVKFGDAIIPLQQSPYFDIENVEVQLTPNSQQFAQSSGGDNNDLFELDNLLDTQTATNQSTPTQQLFSLPNTQQQFCLDNRNVLQPIQPSNGQHSNNVIPQYNQSLQIQQPISSNTIPGSQPLLIPQMQFEQQLHQMPFFGQPQHLQLPPLLQQLQQLPLLPLLQQLQQLQQLPLLQQPQPLHYKEQELQQKEKVKRSRTNQPKQNDLKRRAKSPLSQPFGDVGIQSNDIDNIFNECNTQQQFCLNNRNVLQPTQPSNDQHSNHAIPQYNQSQQQMSSNIIPGGQQSWCVNISGIGTNWNTNHTIEIFNALHAKVHFKPKYFDFVYPNTIALCRDGLEFEHHTMLYQSNNEKHKYATQFKFSQKRYVVTDSSKQSPATGGITSTEGLYLLLVELQDTPKVHIGIICEINNIQQGANTSHLELKGYNNFVVDGDYNDYIPTREDNLIERARKITNWLQHNTFFGAHKYVRTKERKTSTKTSTNRANKPSSQSTNNFSGGHDDSSNHQSE